MIKSMTGFGKASAEINGKKVNIELRSLNSKQLDLNIKMSALYKEKEIELRSEIGQLLNRGKVDLSIYAESGADGVKQSLDTELLAKYYADLKKIESDLKITSPVDYLSLLLRMPEVFRTERAELNESEWNQLLSLVKTAIGEMDKFRITEGKSLEKDLQFRLKAIIDHLERVPSLEKERLNTIKERIRQNIQDFVGSEKFSEDRFEQELIYYIEKLDISEEKTRLATHCNYFLETIEEIEPQGKKLGFISQEMGREINTLGSKANFAPLQQIVVQMKDELEKVKEQLLNVL